MCTLLEVDPLRPPPFDFAISKSLGTSICSFGYALLESWVSGLFEATMCFWVCITCGGLLLTISFRHPSLLGGFCWSFLTLDFFTTWSC